ncbi:MAG: hypothetical protein KDK91_17620 [Gammaproteobacteria bacterium]|nr:hypothetical protein [Gammaproteobacteria bacterium]
MGRLQRFRLDMESVMDQAAEGRTPEPSRLQTLRREIEQLEQERKLLPAQALWLRLVLLQAEQGEQSEAFREQAARLTEQTNEQLARRDAAAQQALIEANEDYRRAELEIVRDYMTRDFVDEQSRQRALRQRLQELRSVYYSGRSTAPDR